MAKQWYIFYIKHTRNAPRLKSLLYGKDCEVWTPTYTYRDILSGVEEKQPLYPGYAFVHIDYSSDIGCLVEGEKLGFVLDEQVVVIGANEVRGQAVPIPDEQIEEIRKLEGSYIVEDNFKIDVNDYIRVERGPFIGFDGKVIGLRNECAKVEIFIFNRIVQVEINARELTKVQRST